MCRFMGVTSLQDPGKNRLPVAATREQELHGQDQDLCRTHRTTVEIQWKFFSFLA